MHSDSKTKYYSLILLVSTVLLCGEVTFFSRGRLFPIHGYTSLTQSFLEYLWSISCHVYAEVCMLSYFHMLHVLGVRIRGTTVQDIS